MRREVLRVPKPGGSLSIPSTVLKIERGSAWRVLHPEQAELRRPEPTLSVWQTPGPACLVARRSQWLDPTYRRQVQPWGARNAALCARATPLNLAPASTHAG